MKLEILRNFPHPWRKRTKMSGWKGAFALFLFCVCVDNVVSRSQLGDYGGGVWSPSVTKYGAGMSDSVNLIVTNFAAVKNNTFKTVNGKKFGKYFLSKKLTSSTGHLHPDLVEAETTASTSTATSPATDGSESPASEATSTTESTTSVPTTMSETSQSSSSTTPEPEFITPVLPRHETAAAVIAANSFESQKETPSNLSLSGNVIFDNFYEVLPVPSGFSSNVRGQLGDLASLDNLRLNPMNLATLPDPDNLALTRQEVNDLDVPDQIAMGSDFGTNVAIVPPPGAQRRQFHRHRLTTRFPNSYEKFGVKDSLFYKLEGGPPPGPLGKKRFPAGFPGTPPPLSQAGIPSSSHAPFIRGNRHHSITQMPRPSGGFSYTRGGLHTPAASTIRTSSAPNHYHRQTSYTPPSPTTFRPVIHTTSGLNHGDHWIPSSPLNTPSISHYNRKDNMLGAGSEMKFQGMQDFIHPGNEPHGPHPPTPPPAAHQGEQEASGSIIGSFLDQLKSVSLPSLPSLPSLSHLHSTQQPFHSNPGLRQLSAPNLSPALKTEKGTGASFFDFGAGHPVSDSNHREPHNNHHHHHHHAHHHSHHPSHSHFRGPHHSPRPHPFLGTGKHPQQSPAKAIAIPIPQDELKGPPPLTLKLGPPPFNEFNIQPVPQQQPKYKHQHLPSHHQEQNHHHHQHHHHPTHAPNNQASHFPTQLSRPDQGPGFGDFGGFDGSNLPPSVNDHHHDHPGPSHATSFSTFSAPKELAEGFPFSPGSNSPPFIKESSPQNGPLGDPGDGLWVAKPPGHSHRHRYVSQSSSTQSFDDSPSPSRPSPTPLMVQPGLAGIPGGNTPLLPKQNQLLIEEINQFDGLPSTQPQHDIGDIDSPPAGFYELPSPPSLFNRPGSDESPTSRPENEQSQNGNSEPGVGPQGEGTPLIYISESSAGNSGEPTSYAPGQRERTREQEGFQDYGGFSVEPPASVTSTRRPRPRGQSQETPYKSYDGHSKEKYRRRRPRPQNQVQSQSYESTNVGFQDFGNFPGNHADLVMGDNNNNPPELNSNEIGDGDYRPNVNTPPSDYESNPHLQNGPQIIKETFQEAGGTLPATHGSREQLPVRGSPAYKHKQTTPYYRRRPAQSPQPEEQPVENPEQGPGPEFMTGLNGFGIGPGSYGKPLNGPVHGVRSQGPVTSPVIRGNPGVYAPVLIGGPKPKTPAIVGSTASSPDEITNIDGDDDGDHSGHGGYKYQPQSPYGTFSAQGLFNGLGELLQPLKHYVPLMKNILQSQNYGSGAGAGSANPSPGMGIGLGRDPYNDLKFNFPGKGEFNFGQNPDTFDMEREKFKINKNNFNFGNEGFSFGPNTFNFPQEAQKFGKDPFGLDAFGGYKPSFHSHSPAVLKQNLHHLKEMLPVKLGHLGHLGHKDLHHLKEYLPVDLIHKGKYPVGKIVKAIVAIGNKILSFYAKFAIPKDHYVRVLSFAGIYLLLAWLVKDNEHLLHPKCESWGWKGPDHHSFHAPPYFVPSIPADPHVQQDFLDLFRGVENCLDEKIKKMKKKKKKKDKKKKDHKKDHKHNDLKADKKADKKDDKKKKGRSDDSSEEDDFEDEEYDAILDDYNDEIGFVNELCGRDQFFFTMSPYHVQATMILTKMFVAQKTPNDVVHLAASLLHSHRVNPKVWYIALVAAAGQRADMIGYQIPFALDALPDWFIPGHLIEDDYNKRYRGLLPDPSPVSRSKRSASSLLRSFSDSLRKQFKSLNGTIFRGNVKERYNRWLSGRNSTLTTTLAPLQLTTLLETITTTLGTPAPTTLNSSTVEEVVNSLFFRRDGEDSPESDEIDDDDDDYGGKKKNVKKNPLGHGFGHVGDGYGKYQKSPFGAGIGGANGMSDYTYVGKPNGNPQGFPSGSGVFPGTFPAHDEKKKGHVKKGKGKKKDKDKKHKKDKKDKKKKCVIIDGSVGLDNGLENKLWYFREDLMLNQHHWYWHMAYPVNHSITLDRRSELFFFMHREMVARYNAERLSNGFHRVLPLELAPGAPIPLGYNSHLKDFAADAYWTPRAPKTPLVDIWHGQDPTFERDTRVNDIVDVYNRLMVGIKLGKLTTDIGFPVPIRYHNGIGPLGETIDASNASVSLKWYDIRGLHNQMHVLIGLSSDPDFKKGLPSGVLAEAVTSMRDPVFYNLHERLDRVFEKFKKTLPPYRPYGGVWPLQWHGVEIIDVNVHTQGLKEHNQLATFFIKHKFQLEPGVDRSIAKGIEKADICAVHLDHAPFQYQIVIDRKKCAKSKSGLGTIRIFIAPRFDEHGERMSLHDQRRQLFQLDGFQAELKVGRNVITRNSKDSTLTRPWSRSLRELEKAKDTGAADYCGCGWPQHLLIPKGNTKGMAFDLFVMVTNFDEDFVANSPEQLKYPETCNSPYIFCGRPRRRYPDGRPMGYPFDRLPYHVPAKPCYGYGHSMKDLLCKLTGKFFSRPVATLEEYVSGLSNAAMTVFQIKHIPKVIGKHSG